MVDISDGVGICSDSDFICKGNKQCVPQNKTCDDHPDCLDGSDEMICNNDGDQGKNCSLNMHVSLDYMKKIEISEEYFKKIFFTSIIIKYSFMKSISKILFCFLYINFYI